MDENTNLKRTSSRRYLRDEPSVEDKFGAHKRIAIGMADAIYANPNLKVVGLLGPWGSGKSTIVGFLEQELKADLEIETHLLTYDAWVHQNDPPRRAFLQELLQFLISKRLTTKSRWQRKLDQLNGQIQDTLVTRTPLFTTGGASIFFSLLLSPFGASLLMKAGIEDAIHGKPGFSSEIALGALLLFAPVLVAVSVYLMWRPIRKPWKTGYFKRENFTKHREPMSDQSILAMFMSKEITSHKDSVTRDPVPTAIEFQQIFRAIMHVVADRNRRFVFVIDNLDRLPPDQAIEMWSTIRSFFLGAAGSLEEAEKAELPTVILPLDEQTVKEIYGGPSNSDRQMRASAFMEKTFDLTFRVPCPVFTDWQSYLQSQMEVLFGSDLKGAWVRQTTAFLDAQFLQKPLPAVTPRRINTLLNTIGLTWEQWKNSGISFASVAYYCIFRDLFDSGLQLEIVAPLASIDRYDPDWQRSVAALHYGVDPEVAYQVLLEGPLRSAIASSKDEDFSLLAQSPGFHSVLHRIVQKLRDTENLAPDTVMKTINVLGRATLASSNEMADEWQLLYEAFIRTSAWAGLGVDEIEAVEHLLHRSSDSERHAVIASTLSHVINSAAKSESGLATSLGALLNKIDADYPRLIEGFDELLVPDHPQIFVRVAAVCLDRPEILARLNCGASTDEIGSALLERLDTNLPSEEPDSCLKGVLKTRHDTFGAQFYEAMGQILTRTNHPGAATALLAIGLGKRAGDENAVGTAMDLSQSGRLATLITESWSWDNYQVLVRAAALLILLQPAQYPPLSTPMPKAALAELVGPLELSLCEFGAPSEVAFRELAKIAVAAPDTRGLLSQILSLRIRQEQIDGFTGEDLFAEYDNLRAVLDSESFSGLLKLLGEADGLLRSLAARPVDESSLGALQILHEEGRSHAERSGEVLASLVDEITPEVWAEAIAHPNIAMLAVNLLKQLSSSPIAISKHAAPLTMAMEQVFAPPSRDWHERWFLLSRLLPPSNRQTLLRTLRDRIISATPAATLVSNLDLGGDELIVEGHFEERADEFVRLLVPPFYTQSGAREYLITYAASLAPLVGRAALETRQTIFDWLKEMNVGAEGPDSQLAEALLASWSPHLEPG